MEQSIIQKNILKGYDEENSNKILDSTDPLILDKETGDMKTTNGDVVAKVML